VEGELLSDWSAKLSRPLQHKDETILTTLAEARDCILMRFVGVRTNEPLVHAIVLLMKAAETKKR
jgi:hypothetical protein